MTEHYYFGHLQHFIGEAELRTPVIYKAEPDDQLLVEHYIASTFWDGADRDIGAGGVYTFNHGDRAVRFQRGCEISQAEFQVLARYIPDSSPDGNELEKLRQKHD